MNFTCPHCGVPQVVTAAAQDTFSGYAAIGEAAELGGRSELGVGGHAVRCANPECKRLTVSVWLAPSYFLQGGGGRRTDPRFVTQRLYPLPGGKPFPDSVPAAMLEDYKEAWSIISLSPKSSATLARRCLQAMIRDFCGIRERTLYHEIEKLETLLGQDALPKGVEAETVAAMRVLKDVGNIGAHFTEEAGQILDVEPEEAEKLLGLIEMLFSDWYVARAKRQEQLAQIEAMARPRPAAAPAVAAVATASAGAPEASA